MITHERSCDARLAVVRLALRRLDWPSSFHLVLERPDQPATFLSVVSK